MTPTPEEGVLLIDQESLHLLSKVEKKYSSVSFPTTQTDASSTISAESEEKKPTITSQIWDSYYDALQKRPLLIKSITAFVVLSVADCMAQVIEMIRSLPNSAFDLPRVLHYGFIGLAGAPWTHYYYAWLDHILPPTREPWTWTTTSKFTFETSCILFQHYTYKVVSLTFDYDCSQSCH